MRSPWKGTIDTVITLFGNDRAELLTNKDRRTSSVCPAEGRSGYMLMDDFNPAGLLRSATRFSRSGGHRKLFPRVGLIWIQRHKVDGVTASDYRRFPGWRSGPWYRTKLIGARSTERRFLATFCSPCVFQARPAPNSRTGSHCVGRSRVVTNAGKTLADGGALRKRWAIFGPQLNAATGRWREGR